LSFGTLALVLAPSAAWAALPALTAASSTEVAQGGRLVLTGTAFGPGGAGSRVEIGGLSAATSHWAEGRIVAYVREGIPAGATTVRVVNPDGASATLPLTVTPVPTHAGRVAWIFEGEGDAGAPHHRPTIAPDGSVYLGDSSGFVYALSPTGIVRWIHDSARATGATSADAAQGPIARGADGTLYVAVQPIGPVAEVHALAPDGSLHWIHRSEAEGWTIAGPATGPDGDIYIVRRGVAAEAITPAGTTRWLVRAGEIASRNDTWGEEIVFGPSRPGGPVDQFYVALYQRFRTSPEPIDVLNVLYGFGLGGEVRFRTPLGSLSTAYGQRQGQPEVGPDGAVYVSSRLIPNGWGVQRFDPTSGAQEWSWHADAPNTLSEPNVGPDGNVYATHNTRYLVSVSPEGSLRWTRDLVGLSEGPIAHPAGETVLAVGTLESNRRLALTAVATADGALRWREEIPGREGHEYMPNVRLAFDATGDRAYATALLRGVASGYPGWAVIALDTRNAGTGGGDAGTGGGDAGTGTDAATGDDAGSTGDAAPTPDAGSPAADGGSSTSRGGCNAAPASTAGTAAPLLAALGALSLRARRRRVR
jgi:hypothetical protein